MFLKMLTNTVQVSKVIRQAKDQHVKDVQTKTYVRQGNLSFKLVSFFVRHRTTNAIFRKCSYVSAGTNPE